MINNPAAFTTATDQMQYAVSSNKLDTYLRVLASLFLFMNTEK